MDAWHTTTIKQLRRGHNDKGAEIFQASCCLLLILMSSAHCIVGDAEYGYR